MDTIIIKQPAGIGDIFYTLKIAKKVLDDNKAKRVIWPVIDEFNYISNYIKYPGLEFTCVSNFNWNQYPVVNLQDADQIYRDCSIMTAKYKLIGLSDTDWLDYFDFERNISRENDLFRTLNLSKDEDYVVISELYGSPPHSLQHIIPIETTKRKIYIKYLLDVNLFDWCGVFEHASEIRMVDTSFMYILEKLQLKSTKNYLYSRYKPSNFDVIKHIPKNVRWKLTNW